MLSLEIRSGHKKYFFLITDPQTSFALEVSGDDYIQKITDSLTSVAVCWCLLSHSADCCQLSL